MYILQRRPTVRTTDSNSVNLGSNPSAAANLIRGKIKDSPLRLFFYFSSRFIKEEQINNKA